MNTALLLFSCALSLFSAVDAPRADPWEPVRFLEGEWAGVAQGEPGIGTVHRSYQFILGHRFLHERNVSAYAAKQPNTPGELHEHWSLISFDKQRKRLVLRQFHQEGFVNQYVFDAEHSSPRRLVFVSESFENLDSRWRARETYVVVSPDEFTETFELAMPGKDFSVYSKTSLKRVKPE
jgi:rubredoxin